METFLAPVPPGRVIREDLALWDGGICGVPKARVVPPLGSPGLSLGPLHSGSSVYSFCGDTLEALKETVCSCFFYPVPDSLLSCSLLFQEHSHPCINNAYVEAPHIKVHASEPVTFADCPFLMVPLREVYQPGA